MKSSYINKGRKNSIKILFSLILSLAALFAFSANAFAAMGMPGDNGVGIANGMDRGMGNDRGTRMGEGLDNNIPEGGVPTPSDTVHGNLGDTDGDGVVEDKGTGEGIIGDIGDMGSEIVSDIGEAGSEIISDIGDGLGDGTKAPDTNKTPADSGMANETEGRAGTIVAIVIAVLVAIALIILILVLIPRDKNKKR
ncbi:MAG: hypothetical protein IKJ91_00720 [Clostridia bacterium]|nr:hypothetical protein [Clostridia bacterium]